MCFWCKSVAFCRCQILQNCKTEHSMTCATIRHKVWKCIQFARVTIGDRCISYGNSAIYRLPSHLTRLQNIQCHFYKEIVFEGGYFICINIWPRTNCGVHVCNMCLHVLLYLECLNRLSNYCENLYKYK